MIQEIQCDETVWINDVPIHVTVTADVDLTHRTCSLVSVIPYITHGVGEKVEYKPCILSQLSQEQAMELEDSMLGHAED